jgi:hypothetical protein
MQKLTGVISAAVVCFSALIPPAMGATAQNTVDVKLTIEQYLSVNVRSDITMTTVTSAWFGNERKSSGSAWVDVSTNVEATLKCPEVVTLTGSASGGTYSLDAEITLIGINSAYWLGDYVCIDFAPGSHIGETTVNVSIKKTWTVADVADTYTGTVTLELVPK